MSDYQTVKHNMEIIRNTRLKAINSLNSAISDILYITTTDEIEGRTIETDIDKIGMQIVKLKNELKDIKI